MRATIELLPRLPADEVVDVRVPCPAARTAEGVRPLNANPAFGSYQVTARLEGGRFGPLYAGRDPIGGESVLIRTFAGTMTLERQDLLLERLTQLCTRPLEHPSIARALECGVSDVGPYIVHEAVRGLSVDEYLATMGPRPVAEVAERVSVLASAIDFADGRGIHHGSLGPRDIGFTTGDSAISGFGLAQAVRAAGLDSNEPSLADDIYALGAMAFELLLRRRFEGGDLRAALAGLDLPRPRLDALVRAFESAFSPDSRLWSPSAREFADSLREAAEPTPMRSESAAPSPGRLAFGSGDTVGIPSRPTAPSSSDPGSLGLLFDAPLLLFEAESAASRTQQSQDSEDATLVSAGVSRSPVARPISSDDLRSEESAILVDRPEPLPPDVTFATVERPGTSHRLWAVAAVAAVLLAAVGIAFFGRYRGAPTPAEKSPLEIARVPVEEQQPIAAPPETVAELPASSDSVAGDSAASTGAPTAVPPADSVADSASQVRDVPSAPPQPFEPAPAFQGRLLLRSTPSGAQVMIDGQRRGETPLAVRGLEYGVYTVTVNGPGIGSWERRVELTVDRPSRSFDIGNDEGEGAQPGQSATAAALHVDSRPSGAGVWLDGVRVGTTPLSLSQVGSGSHAVRIELPGYRPWVTSVAVAGGERARVAASLER